MAGICFYFEDYDLDVYSGRNIDLDSWNYAIQAGGSDMKDMLVLNQTDQKIRTPNKQINFKTCLHSERTPHPKLEGRVAYFVVPTDTRVQNTLWEFDHEVDWYCFGPGQRDNFSPKKGDVFVTVPMPVQLHAVHIASVVMAHRFHVRNK